MLSLNGCSSQDKAFVVDGAGFSHVELKRESSAYLINNDLDAYRDIRGNNETCARMTGCAKVAHTVKPTN
jgi:hypothetical protein